MSKRTWETPELEVFGSMPELTATKADPDPMGAPNAKLAGEHDGAPHQDCPPGQAKMEDGNCGPGIPGLS